MTWRKGGERKGAGHAFHRIFVFLCLYGGCLLLKLDVDDVVVVVPSNVIKNWCKIELNATSVDA